MGSSERKACLKSVEGRIACTREERRRDGARPARLAITIHYFVGAN